MKSLCDTCLSKIFCDCGDFDGKKVFTEQLYQTGERIITECDHYFNKD